MPSRTVADITLLLPDLEPDPVWDALRLSEQIDLAHAGTFEVTERSGYDDVLTGTLVSSAIAYADALAVESVVRVDYEAVADGATAECGLWRVTERVADERGGDGLTFRARPLWLDLLDSVLTYTDSQGVTSPFVSVFDMAWDDALNEVFNSNFYPPVGTPITSGLSGASYSVYTAFPDSIAPASGDTVTVSGEAMTHLDFFRAVAEQAGASAGGARLRFQAMHGRTGGGTDYHWIRFGVVALPDASSPVATITPGHQFALTRRADSRQRVTGLVPVAGPEGGGRTIGALAWEITTVVSPTQVTLAQPAATGYLGRTTPIWATDALVGSYLEAPDGTRALITDTSAPGTVTVASGGYSYSAGDVGSTVRFKANSAGDELTTLRVPNLASDEWVNDRARRYETVAPVPNLLETNGHTADFNEVTTGWSLLGTASTATGSSLNATYATYGPGVVELTAGAVDDGIETDLFTLDPKRAPYVSAWLAAYPVAVNTGLGKWLVELVDGAGNPFPPEPASGEDYEVLFDEAEDEAIGLAGFQPAAEGTARPRPQRVKLRVTCVDLDGESTAKLILDASTVTQSQSEYVYEPGLGPHQAWRLAAQELQRLGRGRVPTYGGDREFSAEIADPLILADLGQVEVGDVVTVERSVSEGDLDLAVTALTYRIGKGLGSPTPIRRVVLGQPPTSAGARIGAALGIAAPEGATDSLSEAPLPVKHRPPRAPQRTKRLAYGDVQRAQLAVLSSGRVLDGRAVVPSGSSSVTVTPGSLFLADGVQITPEGVPGELFGVTNIDGAQFDIETAANVGADTPFKWRVTLGNAQVPNFTENTPGTVAEIYFTSRYLSRAVVYKAAPDGSGVTQLYSDTGGDDGHGITYSPLQDLIYVVHKGTNKIVTVAPDGTGKTDWKTGLLDPSGIVCLRDAGVILWTEDGNGTSIGPRVVLANEDGTGQAVFWQAPADIDRIDGIDYDWETGNVFVHAGHGPGGTGQVERVYRITPQGVASVVYDDPTPNDSSQFVGIAVDASVSTVFVTEVGEVKTFDTATFAQGGSLTTGFPFSRCGMCPDPQASRLLAAFPGGSRISRVPYDDAGAVLLVNFSNFVPADVCAQYT